MLEKYSRSYRCNDRANICINISTSVQCSFTTARLSLANHTFDSRDLKNKRCDRSRCFHGLRKVIARSSRSGGRGSRGRVRCRRCETRQRGGISEASVVVTWATRWNLFEAVRTVFPVKTSSLRATRAVTHGRTGANGPFFNQEAI